MGLWGYCCSPNRASGQLRTIRCTRFEKGDMFRAPMRSQLGWYLDGGADADNGGGVTWQ